MPLFVYLVAKLALLIVWAFMVSRGEYWWSVAPMVLFVLTRWPKGEKATEACQRIADWSDDQVATAGAAATARAIARRAVGMKP